MHELTTAKKEAYVRSKWRMVYYFPETPADEGYLLQIFKDNSMREIYEEHSMSAEDAWDAAYAFTLAREEEVRQVEEEVALLKGWRYVQEGISPQATRILAREQAALDELKRGMRGDSKC